MLAQSSKKTGIYILRRSEPFALRLLDTNVTPRRTKIPTAKPETINIASGSGATETLNTLPRINTAGHAIMSGWINIHGKPKTDLWLARICRARAVDTFLWRQSAPSCPAKLDGVG